MYILYIRIRLQRYIKFPIFPHFSPQNLRNLIKNLLSTPFRLLVCRDEQLDQLRSKLSRWNAKEQQIYRSFIADAILLTLDGNGRFLIPKRQMKLADIEQNIRFVGMGDTIEIWRSNGEEEAFMDSEEFSKALQEIMSSNNTVKE